MTSFQFRTHPAKIIYGGPLFFELADAVPVMRWYRGFLSDTPDEFYIFLGLHIVMPADPFPQEHRGKKSCVLVVAHNGPTTDAERAVNTMRAALPKPIIDWAQPMPYTILQSMFDEFLTKGMQWYWKGDFVRTLPDAAIEAHLAHLREMPSPFSLMHLYPIDAAVHRQNEDATAWGCRDATWSMGIAGVDPNPSNFPTLKKWARDYWQALHPFNLNGA